MSRAASRRRPRALPLALAAWLACGVPATRAQAPSPSPAPSPAPVPRALDLSGPGWRLWRDPVETWPDEPPVPPGTPLAELPAPAPTGGWARLDAGRPVSVPTSLEALFGPDEPDPRGVSWWSRELTLPAAVLEAPAAWRVSLAFGAVGRRAEVFVDRQLVGRDDVGNSPFEIALPAALLRPRLRLDVRVTDPGGNFGWEDEDAHPWGAARIPAAHGFGGLLADVELRVRPVLHVVDLWVQAGAPGEAARLHLELDPGLPDERAPVTPISAPAPPPPGPAGEPAPDADPARWAPLQVTVSDPARPDDPPLFDHAARVPLPTTPGAFTRVVELPLGDDAPRWSPEDPALLLVRVRFGADELRRSCGLRRFRVAGLGERARLELDGAPRLLRSAISWGYWPVTGAVPTQDLARRQVEAARELGLDMLNHHRNFPHPRLLPWHDALGLLAHVEPGGYASLGGDALAEQLARERWLRLVRVARRHPSVVMANMINEAKQPPGARGRRDLADAQALAPELLLTYTSGWAETDPPEHGLHARPGEPGLHEQGWWDMHHAPGPGVWRDAFWQGPEDHLRRSTDQARVVFLGEDGAIGSPPRLPSLVDAWADRPAGWDGAAYAARLAAWRADFAAHGWDASDAALEQLFRGFGDVVYDYHARVVENLRLGGVVDGYVINGWDDQKAENHSGLVDALRRPKGHPGRLAAVARAQLLAVKPHASVLQVRPVYEGARLPTELVVDLGWVDDTPPAERLAGPHQLVLRVHQQGAGLLLELEREVHLAGDGAPRFLLEGERLALPAEPGWLQLEALLTQERDGERVIRARGGDRVLAVDGRHRAVPPGGALLDDERRRLTKHFRDRLASPVPRYDPEGPAPRWVLVADLDPEPTEPVPASAFRQDTRPDAPAGLRRELFAGDAFQRFVERGVDTTLSVIHDPHAPPGGLEPPYTLRWSGALLPPETGSYRFATVTAGGVRLRVDGRVVLERWPDDRPDVVHGALVQLEAGRAVSLELEYQQLREASRVSLEWMRPTAALGLQRVAGALLRRVERQGTTVVFLDHADGWARLLERAGLLADVERLKMERYWLGGGFFARPHALLDGLPAGGALGRPWQTLVHYGNPLFGLRAEGLRRVVGTHSDHSTELGTALGWLPHGRGRLLLSTLEIVPALDDGPGAASLPRHLLLNLVEWAAKS